MKEPDVRSIETEEYKKQVFKLIEVIPEKRTVKSWEQSGAIIKNDNDFEKENSRKRIKGKESEEIAYNYEVENLTRQDRKDLADKVDVKSNDVCLGYDILSYDIEGNEKHIEVKTRSSNNIFWLTRNELEISRNDKNYYIYIVDKKTFKIFDLKFSDIDKNYTMIPQVYKVYF